MTRSFTLKFFSGILFSFLLITSHFSQEQPLPVNPVSLNVKSISLNQVFKLLEKQTGFRFAYNSDLIAGMKVNNINVRNISLSECLNLLFNKLPIDFYTIGKQIILRPKPTQLESSKENDSKVVRENIPLNTINPIYAPLESKFPGLKNVLTAEHKSQLIRTGKIIEQPDSLDAENSRVKGDGNMLYTTLNDSMDLLHALQIHPAVLAGLDLSSGYLIRGGSGNQNLVEMDGITLYNTGHLFGLVSTLDQSVIKSTELFTEGIPALYGGSLSSALKICMKEGNYNETAVMLKLGNTDAGIALQGPVISNKASFIISARRSTIDLLLKPVVKDNYYSNYDFYGIDAKISFRPSLNNQFYLTLYKGRDNTSYSRDSLHNGSVYYDAGFGNTSVAFRWNHQYSTKLVSGTTFSYNEYNQTIAASQEKFSTALYSGIKELQLKSDFTYHHKASNKFTGGIHYAYQSLVPGYIYDKLKQLENSLSIDPSAIQVVSKNQLSFHLADDVIFSSLIHGYFGIRIPVFIADEAVYVNPEPRLSMTVQINPTTGFTVSYDKIHQYLHQVAGYNASFPANIWIGSSKDIEPQKSNQLSIGLLRSFMNNRVFTALKLYYRNIENLHLFKGEKTPAVNSNIERTIITGNEKGYGSEFIINKNYGNLTGTIAYALSFADKKFKKLNNGDPFPSAENRRHSLKVSANYRINSHWEIFSGFIAASGRAFTLSNTESEGSTDSPLYYNPTGNEPEIQNNFSLLPYHRLDIGISYSKQRQLHQRVLESRFEFTLFNVYARANSFFSYRSLNTDTNLYEVNQVSLIPVLPCFTYYIRF